MGLLVRAVVTGFGLSIGAALYKRVAKQLGLEDKDTKDKDKAADTARGAAGMASDPGSLRPTPQRH